MAIVAFMVFVVLLYVNDVEAKQLNNENLIVPKVNIYLKRLVRSKCLFSACTLYKCHALLILLSLMFALVSLMACLVV